MQLRWKVKGSSGPSFCIGMTHVPTGKLHPLTEADVKHIMDSMKKYGPGPKDMEEPVTVVMEDHPDAVPR